LKYIPPANFLAYLTTRSHSKKIASESMACRTALSGKGRWVTAASPHKILNAILYGEHQKINDLTAVGAEWGMSRCAKGAVSQSEQGKHA
jgi:hypothetical protein